MEGKKLHLSIVSPSKLIIDKDVDMVIMRTVGGDMGVLPGHENTTTILSLGEFRTINNDEEEVLSVLGGFAEVTSTSVTVLTDAAELGQEIDKDRAMTAKERAEGRINNNNGEIDIHRAELALRRANVRLEVYNLTHKK